MLGCVDVPQSLRTTDASGDLILNFKKAVYCFIDAYDNAMEKQVNERRNHIYCSDINNLFHSKCDRTHS